MYLFLCLSGFEFPCVASNVGVCWVKMFNSRVWISDLTDAHKFIDTFCCSPDWHDVDPWPDQDEEGRRSAEWWRDQNLHPRGDQENHPRKPDRCKEFRSNTQTLSWHQFITWRLPRLPLCLLRGHADGDLAEGNARHGDWDPDQGDDVIRGSDVMARRVGGAGGWQTLNRRGGR